MRTGPTELSRLRHEVADLEAYCAALKGALMAADIPLPSSRDPNRYRFKGVTRQEGTLLGMLAAAYPRALSRQALLERLPYQGDDDALDREVGAVAVLVSHIRKHMGRGAIETVWGFGYKLGDQFHAELETNPALIAC